MYKKKTIKAIAKEITTEKNFSAKTISFNLFIDDILVGKRVRYTIQTTCKKDKGKFLLKNPIVVEV